MIKRLAALLIILNGPLAYAQTIKTGVLVIGGTPSGVAAAMQCARSKVKTLLIDQGPVLCPGMADAATVTIKADRNLPSGIWGEFRGRVMAQYKNTPGHDTAFNAVLKLEPAVGASILTQMADSVKGLSIKLNTTFTSLTKEDDGWEVTITQNGKTQLIKTRVVIDATTDGAVSKKAYATYQVFDNKESTSASNAYRTSIAMGDALPGIVYNDQKIKNNYPPFPSYGMPMHMVIARGTDNVENLLITDNLLPANRDMQYLPVELTLGQGAGVVAAYCAFFKTTTANLNVRMIQGELLDFKGYILPLEDISRDPHWRDIQQVCATGLLKGVQNNKGQLLFMPDSIVTTAEIKPVLLEIYTRAFLWFSKEKPGDDFTVGDMLSLISDLSLTDPDNLQQRISKAWNTQYRFNGNFDMDRPITRRQFAILANQFLNPFARTVDLDGRMVN